MQTQKRHHKLGAGNWARETERAFCAKFPQVGPDLRKISASWRGV